MLGVPLACSIYSPNALLGTLTPENSSKPAAAQAGDAAGENADIGVTVARQDRGRALGKAVVVVAQHDARRAARHQLGELQFEAAQWHRARQQQMVLRKDQLLAHVDERELAAVAEHAPQSQRG